MSEDPNSISSESIKAVRPTMDITLPHQEGSFFDTLTTGYYVAAGYLPPSDRMNIYPGHHLVAIQEWNAQSIEPVKGFVDRMTNSDPIPEISDIYTSFHRKLSRHARRSIADPATRQEMQNQLRQHEDVHRMQEIRFESPSTLDKSNEIFARHDESQIARDKKLQHLANLSLKTSMLQELEAFYATIISPAGDPYVKNINTVLSLCETSQLFIRDPEGVVILDKLFASIRHGIYYDAKQSSVVNIGLLAKSLILLTDLKKMQSVLAGNFDSKSIRTSIIDGFRRLEDSPGQFIKVLRQSQLTQGIDQQLMNTSRELKVTLKELHDQGY